MKKLITLALCTMAFAGASAKDLAVITDGALQPGLVCYGWWNQKDVWEAPNPSGEATVWTISANDGGKAFSCGIYTDGVKTGPLHSATLNFNWYSPSEGAKYHIRLTGKTEKDYVFEVTADNANKWNDVSINIAETFPTIAEEWTNFEMAGKGYVFSIVSEETSPEGSTISFQNVYYSNLDEAWTEPAARDLPTPTTVPAPTQTEDAVISLYSYAYPAVTTFNIGGWGQSTQAEEIEVDGKKIWKLNYFNYLGWELANHVDLAHCDKVHVDVFPATGNYMGFTPISPGHELTYACKDLKVGEWNSVDADLSYFTGVDMKDIFQFKFDGGNQDPYYIGNVYFYNSRGENAVTSADLTVADANATYFNLQGQRVANPAAGEVYIRVAGNKTAKVRF